jgi:hypothetical protein
MEAKGSTRLQCGLTNEEVNIERSLSSNQLLESWECNHLPLRQLSISTLIPCSNRIQPHGLTEPQQFPAVASHFALISTQPPFLLPSYRASLYINCASFACFIVIHWLADCFSVALRQYWQHTIPLQPVSRHNALATGSTPMEARKPHGVMIVKQQRRDIFEISLV